MRKRCTAVSSNSTSLIGLELEAVEPAGGALAKRVEAADALHLVAEKIEANGLGGPRRKEVDDAAASAYSPASRTVSARR